MISPVTRNSVCELADLPHRAGEIPTAWAKLEGVETIDLSAWLDERLADLEWKFQAYWTHESTLDAIYQGKKRR